MSVLTPSAEPVPQRVLIVRISALGDLVFCTALLDGLRRAYPKAHIAWLAQPGFAGLLDGDPRLDTLIRLPPRALEGITGLIATWRLLRQHAPYDWVIDAQGLLKTRVLARLAPARRRIGFASREPGGFLLDRLIDKGGELADISSEYRFMAQGLTGQDPGPPRLLPAQTASPLPPRYIALCPFTTRPQKHWMEAYWGELAHALRGAGLGPCVIFGGPADRLAADRIMATMPRDTVDQVGKTRIAELPALLQHAALVIGVDTGLTHIGVALQRPVVALFGSTCPYTRGTTSPLRVMYDALPCAPCKRRPTCQGAYTCLRGLTPARVAQAAIDICGDS